MHEKSPRFQSYIPFIYLSWVDNTLSPAEWNVIKPYIKKDDEIPKSEKSELIAFLNSENPPKESDFEEWRDWMVESKVKINPDENYPLSTFAQALSGIEDIESHKSIEKNLDLRPSLYKHAFPYQQKEKKQFTKTQKKEVQEWFSSHCETDTSEIDEFLEKKIFEWKIIRDKEKFRERVLEQVKTLGQHDYGGISYPQEYGGNDELAAYGVIFEKLIAVDPSLAVRYGVQFGLFGGSIYNLGTDKHHKKWLEKIGRAEVLGCFAMTETSHGSNVRHLQTRATYDKEKDCFYIHTPNENDNKEYIGNALSAEYATVFAQLIANGENHGVHAFVVRMRDENGNLRDGIKVEDNGYKLGLNGIDNGKIWFDHLEVPRFNLLDKFGSVTKEGEYSSPIESEGRRFFTMLGTLIGGRICVGKGAIKGAQYSLAVATNYALERRQFGPDNQQNEELLIDYPSHQKRLIPRIARSLTLHIAFEDLIEQFENVEPGESRQIESEVAALKAAATWYADDTNQECREACGGKGYLTENRIADMKGDIDIFTTFEGDNTVLTQLAAKGILSEFQSQFSSGDFTSVMKFLGLQVQSTIAAYNPMYRGKTDKEHLRNPKFHRHALNYRLDELKLSLTSRLRALIQRKIDPYDAFLRTQNHVIAVGKAYADYLEVEKFYSTMEDKLDDNSEKTQKLIKNLATLSSLSLIYEHNDWYLEKSYINATKSKAIRNQIEQLCLEIRPYLPDLIECFNIPEFTMDVDIANINK